MPLPDPDPAVTVSQVALLLAVQAQPLPAVTATLPPPPEAAKVLEVGVMEWEHGLAWVTVTVCPATFKLPALADPVLAPTEKVTVPLPDPLAPEVIPIQLSLLLAVQAQPLPAVTAIFPFPPEASKFCEEGVIE